MFRVSRVGGFRGFKAAAGKKKRNGTKKNRQNGQKKQHRGQNHKQFFVCFSFSSFLFFFCLSFLFPLLSFCFPFAFPSLFLCCFLRCSLLSFVILLLFSCYSFIFLFFFYFLILFCCECPSFLGCSISFFWERLNFVTISQTILHKKIFGAVSGRDPFEASFCLFVCLFFLSFHCFFFLFPCFFVFPSFSFLFLSPSPPALTWTALPKPPSLQTAQNFVFFPSPATICILSSLCAWTHTRSEFSGCRVPREGRNNEKCGTRGKKSEVLGGPGMAVRGEGGPAEGGPGRGGFKGGQRGLQREWERGFGRERAERSPSSPSTFSPPLLPPSKPSLRPSKLFPPRPSKRPPSSPSLPGKGGAWTLLPLDSGLGVKLRPLKCTTTHPASLERVEPAVPHSDHVVRDHAPRLRANSCWIVVQNQKTDPEATPRSATARSIAVG